MKAELLDRLRPYGQEHLLAFWDELTPAQRDRLARQILALDLAAINELSQTVQQAAQWSALAARAEAPPAFRLSGVGNPFSREDAAKRGEAAIRAGKLGVIIVAGGQGTRLGFHHPKGTYAIGPVSGATLFQIHCERIVARARRYGVAIPLYLMTSPATHDETVACFRAERNFGLPDKDVHIFCQGTMPAIDAKTRKLLLSEKDSLALSPDGHGGTLAALASGGCLDDMRQRGIEHLFYTQVDNPLVSIAEPGFVGYHLLAHSQVTLQVVAKRTSRAKLGNVVVIDGRLQIIEYSDLNPLSDEIVERKLPDGGRLFWAGSIGVHMFERAFLESVVDNAKALPFHIASKAVPFLAADGHRVQPREPNAIKFERFIFDLLPWAETGVVVEVDEDRSFAPVKNAPGEALDSPEYVQRLMMSQHREWLRAAGAVASDGIPVEISPLFGQSAEEVRERLPPQTVVTTPTYFR